MCNNEFEEWFQLEWEGKKYIYNDLSVNKMNATQNYNDSIGLKYLIFSW